MKKSLIVIGLVIIVVAGFFVVRSCEPRTKIEETVPPTEDITQPDVAATLKSAFISANVEFGCRISRNEIDVTSDEEASSALNESYEKYGMPVDDDGLMIKILKLYENDQSVIDTIKAQIQGCK